MELGNPWEVACETDTNKVKEQAVWGHDWRSEGKIQRPENVAVSEQ